MFAIQYTHDDGGRAVAMAMLPPPPTKPITLPWQLGFGGGGKKEEYDVTYLRESSELLEDLAYDCGSNSWSTLRDSVGSFKKRTHRPLVQYITWTRTTQCPTVQLTAWKKTKHAVSRWYRTVYIPWLVASYDMHKCKRWLNSNPPKPHRENGVGLTGFKSRANAFLLA